MTLCGRQSDGTASTVEEIAARGTFYHAMVTLGNNIDTGATRCSESNAGSHEGALSAVHHKGSRTFQENSCRGQGRGCR